MHLMDFDPSFVRQRNEDLGGEVATHRLARRLRDAGRGNRPQVFGEAGKGGSSRAIPVLAAVISLLFALTLWIAAERVHAQELSHTLTVSVTGGGKVTGPGIDCGAGATDCSQSYKGEFRRVCEPDADTGKPVCYQDWFPSTPRLAVNTPDDFRFGGWGGACTGTGNT